MTDRIVLFSFLSRADSTPLDRRSRAESFVLDQEGRPVADPAKAETLAFEPDHNLSFEHWGDYWRKVHGVRFVHPDQESDRQSLEKLLRYDQIHRLAAGPSSETPLPYHPPLDQHGKLFDTIIGHVKPYRRPAWDGIAYLHFANLDDLQAVLGTERVLRKIVPEDQAMFRDLAPVLARHQVISPGTGNDAITLVRSHRRADNLDRSEFQSRWKQNAERMSAQHASSLVQSHVQLHAIGPEAAGAPFYHAATAAIDGLTLLTFGSMRDVERFLLSNDYTAILEAERQITSPQSDFWTGVNFTIVDRVTATIP